MASRRQVERTWSGLHQRSKAALDDLPRRPRRRLLRPPVRSQSGSNDRPAAAVQVYWTARQRRFLQEFSSRSTRLMVADSADEPEWRPDRAGVEFQRVPDAPGPATTAKQRLRQMQSIAEGFAAEHFYYRGTWNTPRLLIKPFARAGKEGSPIEDGALFCFAQGTEPEVLLMLEARSRNDGLEWQYAFAPLTAFEVKASRMGREVWSK